MGPVSDKRRRRMETKVAAREARTQANVKSAQSTRPRRHGVEQVPLIPAQRQRHHVRPQLANEFGNFVERGAGGQTVLTPSRQRVAGSVSSAATDLRTMFDPGYDGVRSKFMLVATTSCIADHFYNCLQSETSMIAHAAKRSLSNFHRRSCAPVHPEVSVS